VRIEITVNSIRRSMMILALALLGASTTLFAQAQAPTVAGTRPACVAVSTQPIFNGTGYNHLVTIANRCAAAVSCTVTTNVNPRPIEAQVAAGEQRTVNTYFNAAGYGFTATVHCASGAR
jgi:hypothetical protein